MQPKTFNMIVKYVHHDTEVSVQEEMLGKHREHCLCYQGCKFFKPETRKGNCGIANAIYKNCVLYGVVTPVWECPKYEKETV